MMHQTTVATHGTEVAVWEVGEGHPLLVLHGLGLDHVGLSEELEPLFEDRAPWRRIYLDLPGMGMTPGAEDLASADAILDLIAVVIESKIGDERFALLGQSYGGYLALGALRTFSVRMSGLALLIPVIEPSPADRDLPDPLKLRTDDNAMRTLPDDFLDGFGHLIVEESPELAGALLRSWIPSMAKADEDFIERLQQESYAFIDMDPTSGEFTGPSLVICGRHDAVVGYADATVLMSQLERGTFAVLDGAGHLAQLEKADLTRALIADWLQRVEDEEGLVRANSPG